jgi:uncharacterized protein (DUF983 family)
VTVVDVAEARPAATAAGRCAAHPGRPAHDVCPTCGRPRCSADAHDRGDRCAVCGAPEQRLRPAPFVVVATAVVGAVLAVVGAAVGQEYVGAHLFSWIFPGLVGVVIAALALTVAGPVHPGLRHLVGLVSAGYAAISALLDFRFTHEPYGPVGRWLPPLVAAVVAAAVAAELLARRPTSGMSSPR